jgi:hypothetical protein
MYLLKDTASFVIVGLAIVGLAYNNPAFAHEFSADESSSFLALIESIKVELELAQTNSVSNSVHAVEHATHAHEHLDEHVIEEIAERNERLARDVPAALEEFHMSIGNSSSSEIQNQIQRINDLLDETVSARIDREQLTNGTTQAIFVATLVDGALEHYKIAHGLGSNGTQHGGNETHESEPSMGEGHSMDDGETHVGQNGNITDIVSYQTAQGLASRALEVFNGTVSELAPANSTGSVDDVHAALVRLNQSIAAAASPNDIELIVHGEVHPRLQEAYNLQIIPEFPAPLLAGIAASAAGLAASRLKRLRS